jgi:hypothetical protein
MGVIISELRCFYNIYQGLIRYSGATMYYVYHTGSHGSSDDDSIHPWDTNTVAEQVVSNGLVDWVLNKAK